MAVINLAKYFAVSLTFCVVANAQEQPDPPVTVKWGVADSTATVGKLFRLHIPMDAFNGKVLSYTVQKSDGSPIPSWLEFDTKDNVLQGIPTPADAGPLYLDITARGANSQASVTSTVLVRDVPSHTSGAPLRFKTSGPESVWCKPTESETIATILIDADFDAMSVTDRLSLLKKFLSHMELHESMLKMMPVGNTPLHDSSALVSGTGDSVAPKTPGLFISWPVGCGQVKEGHFPVLQKLDDDSSSGKMAVVIGHPVIGWQVTNTRFQAPTRKRRQIQATPTPGVTPIMPTKTDSYLETGDERMTHKLVDIQSPTFIQPTAVQTHMPKTDEPVVLPPVQVEDKTFKVMPTETAPLVVPVYETKEMPPIIPTKTDETMKPTDYEGDLDDSCVPGLRPELKSDIRPLNLTVGNIIDFVIPEDTFEDCEVGGTRGLELILYKDKTSVIKPEFFLQFDSKNQKIYGLPGTDDVGHYKFNLFAKKKSSTAVANAEIIVHVKDTMKRKINHELAVVIDYDYDTFMASVSNRIDVANRIANLYGDSDTGNLIVTSIRPGSVAYGWANSSLAAARDCPVEEIKNLAEKLVGDDSLISDDAVEKLKPYVLLGAKVESRGACENVDDFPSIVAKPREQKTAAPEDKDDVKPTNVTTTGEDVAKGSKGGDSEDDIWITTVVPAIIVVVILIIALLIACILYRKKRKGKMNIEEQNTFINKGAPVIFPDELEEKPSDVNKPLLVEGSPAPPPEYHRGTSESPEPQLSGNYRNLSASTPADDGITEMPEKPYEPPPPVTASSNGKQSRPAHQQQPLSQAPQILP